MDNKWIPPFFTPRPSVVGIGADPYKSWPANPEPPSGTGRTSGGDGVASGALGYVAGPYLPLSGMLMENGKLYSFPGMGLHMDTEVGGDMVGSIQFFDDYVKTGEIQVAALSANGVLVPSYTDYGLHDMSVTFDSNGTHEGNWETVGPITAGSGWLISTYGAYGGAGITAQIFYPLPLDTDFSVDGTITLELADSGSNVLVSVDMASVYLNQVSYGTSTLESKHLCSMYEPISWGGTITKARVVCDAMVSPGGAGFSANAGISQYVGIKKRG